MTVEEYKLKKEKELIMKFLKDFHSRIGYYPTVLTSGHLDKDPKNILTLEELANYFKPYLPTEYGKPMELWNKSRKRELVELRQMFCYIARLMGFSLKTIGIYLGNRDHTTVIHSVRTFDNLCETDGGYKEKFNKIISKIKEDGNYYDSSTMVRSYKIQSES